MLPFPSCTDLPTRSPSPSTPERSRDGLREQLPSISPINVRGLAITHIAQYTIAMARSLRIGYPGAVYHITTRGNARQETFLWEEFWG